VRKFRSQRGECFVERDAPTSAQVCDRSVNRFIEGAQQDSAMA
jgi:hypothetical protein